MPKTSLSWLRLVSSRDFHHTRGRDIERQRGADGDIDTTNMLDKNSPVRLCKEREQLD